MRVCRRFCVEGRRECGAKLALRRSIASNRWLCKLAAMPLPVIPNVYRVTLNWDLSGAQTAANVLNFHDSTAGTHDEQDLFTNLNAQVDSNMWSPVADTASVTSVDIIKLDGTTPQHTFTSLTAANWDGGIGGTAVPAVAGLVSLRTSQRGPRGRGRVYLPFVSESEITSGFWTSGAHRAACEAAWEQFITDMSAADWDLQVASYVHGTTETVTNINVPSAFATQRRRQRRLQ